MVTPATGGYVDGGDTYAYDPELAGRLLDEAGWRLGSDGTRSKGGQPLTLTMIDIADFGFDGMSPLIQAQLAEVGITADLSNQAFPTVATTYNQGAQNTASWFFSAVDPNLVKSVFMCDQIASGFNWAHYSNPEIDAAITAANAIVDTDQRTAAYEAITTKLMEDAIFLPLWNVSGIYSAAKNLEDIHFGASGYALFHTAHFA